MSADGKILTERVYGRSVHSLRETDLYGVDYVQHRISGKNTRSFSLFISGDEFIIRCSLYTRESTGNYGRLICGSEIGLRGTNLNLQQNNKYRASRMV